MANIYEAPFEVQNDMLVEAESGGATEAVNDTLRSIEAIRSQIQKTAQDFLRESKRMAGVGAAFIALGGHYLNLAKRLEASHKAFKNVDKELEKVQKTFSEVGKLLRETEQKSQSILGEIDELGSEINKIAT